MKNLKEIIQQAFDNRITLSPTSTTPATKEAIDQVIAALQAGKIRVAEKDAKGVWQVNQWIKKAVLLYFRTHPNQVIDGGFTNFFDKVPLQFNNYTSEQLAESGVRIVPPTCVRAGAYIAPKTVLMPSFVNIGAYIDSGTLIDTWASVGSCAQIGKNVHISGGAGIGGVLEPLQAEPTIIEDNCFIGARSEIVEGVIVERGSVISMGVFIGQSTKIYDRETGTISYGRIPAGSVVVAGNLPAKDDTHSMYAAIIVKKVDAVTRAKVGINELLRDL